jgi:hypothetical protein
MILERGVNIPESGVSMKRNGGSTWSGIYITQFGRGPTIVIDPGIYHNGNGHYTHKSPGLDGGQIEINPLLIKQITSAKTEEEWNAAVLAFYITVLHETIHHGDFQDDLPNDGNSSWYNENGEFYGDNHEKGEAFEIDLFFNKDPFLNRRKQGEDGLNNMKDVYNRKSNSENGRKDLPGVTWGQFYNWLWNTALAENPFIVMRTKNK